MKNTKTHFTFLKWKSFVKNKIEYKLMEKRRLLISLPLSIILVASSSGIGATLLSFHFSFCYSFEVAHCVRDESTTRKGNKD